MDKIWITLESRFLIDSETGCWLWTRGIGKAGYGAVKIGGKQYGAHRLSYVNFKGEIPNGMHVCHTCDTRHCINPDHLFAGTARDNMQDKVRKGRGNAPAGLKHGQAKINPEAVRHIRAAKCTLRELACQFGLSEGQIGKIRRGERWRHV